MTHRSAPRTKTHTDKRQLPAPTHTHTHTHTVQTTQGDTQPHAGFPSFLPSFLPFVLPFVRPSFLPSHPPFRSSRCRCFCSVSERKWPKTYGHTIRQNISTCDLIHFTAKPIPSGKVSRDEPCNAIQIRAWTDHLAQILRVCPQSRSILAFREWTERVTLKGTAEGGT